MDVFFIVYCVITCASRRSNVSPTIARLQETISGRLQPEDSSIDDIVRRLGEIKYKVESRQVQAVQLDRDPDISDLQNQLGREWRLLCLRAGFVHPERIPPLPGRDGNLLLPSAQAYQDMVVALGRGTLNSSRGEALTMSPISSPLFLHQSAYERQSGGTVDSLEFTHSEIALPNNARIGTSRSTTRPPAELESDHPIILGDPALPICVASL